MIERSTAPKTTGKARRKDNAARATAQGLATLGNAKARRKSTDSFEEPVSEANYAHDGPYMIREYVRRDNGVRAQVLALDATDAPAGALEPFTSPDGERMGYAAVCLTHPDTPPRYCATPQQATRFAKATHLFCAECGTMVAQRPNSKASANAKTGNQKRP